MKHDSILLGSGKLDVKIYLLSVIGDLDQVATHLFAHRWWPVCGSASPLWRFWRTASVKTA